MEDQTLKLYENIKKLVQYGIDTGLTPECERIYTTNLLLDLMREDSYEDVDCDLSAIVLEDVLHDLLDEACARGIIEDDITSRDLFDTKLMNTLLPRPAQVQQTFRAQYDISPEAATAYYYKFSQDSDYIRRYRIKKIRNGLWTPRTELWISRSIYPNRKKIRKRLQPQETPLLPAIRNASSAWKTRAMPEEPIIRHGRTTGLSRSRSTIPPGDSSILLMYTTTNIVSYLTANILR